VAVGGWRCRWLRLEASPSSDCPVGPGAGAVRLRVDRYCKVKPPSASLPWIVVRTKGPPAIWRLTSQLFPYSRSPPARS
jgi:hypothetical protein